MLVFAVAAVLEQQSVAKREVALDELIARVGQGDQAAFGELYRLTDSSVFAFALSILKNHHDAQDVMQETYIKIHQHSHRFNGEGHALSWMLAITKNLALMRLRAGSKLSDIDDQTIEQVFPGAQDSTQQSAENRMLLDAALSILPDTQRQIVMLHAVTGLKHREIAQLLELPLSTVLSHYSRSLSRLKKYLEER